MAEENKYGLVIVAIVGIVAVVALIMMGMPRQTTTAPAGTVVSGDSSGNLAGNARSAADCAAFLKPYICASDCNDGYRNACRNCYEMIEDQCEYVASRGWT